MSLWCINKSQSLPSCHVNFILSQTRCICGWLVEAQDHISAQACRWLNQLRCLDISPTFSGIKSLIKNHRDLQFVGCMLSFFSIYTGGRIHDHYCSQSIGGRFFIFLIHFLLISRINRCNNTRQQGLHFFPPCEKRRVRSLHRKHTHHMHSFATLLRLGRKT